MYLWNNRYKCYHNILNNIWITVREIFTYQVSVDRAAISTSTDRILALEDAAILSMALSHTQLAKPGTDVILTLQNTDTENIYLL